MSRQEDFQGCWNGDEEGLIPYEAGWLLTGVGQANSPTLAAYAATSPNQWQQNSQHYCCTTYQAGCAS